MKLTAAEKAYVNLFRSAMAANTREDGWFNATAVLKALESKKRLDIFMTCSYVLNYTQQAEIHFHKKWESKVREGRSYKTYYCPELIPAFSMWVDKLFWKVGEELVKLYVTDPKQLAILSISQVENVEQAKDVEAYAKAHTQYLVLNRLLTDELQKHGFINGSYLYGVVNGLLNDAVNVRNGERPGMELLDVHHIMSLQYQCVVTLRNHPEATGYEVVNLIKNTIASVHAIAI